MVSTVLREFQSLLTAHFSSIASHFYIPRFLAGARDQDTKAAKQSKSDTATARWCLPQRRDKNIHVAPSFHFFLPSLFSTATPPRRTSSKNFLRERRSRGTHSQRPGGMETPKSFYMPAAITSLASRWAACDSNHRMNYMQLPQKRTHVFSGKKVGIGIGQGLQ